MHTKRKGWSVLHVDEIALSVPQNTHSVNINKDFMHGITERHCTYTYYTDGSRQKVKSNGIAICIHIEIKRSIISNVII